MPSTQQENYKGPEADLSAINWAETIDKSLEKKKPAKFDNEGKVVIKEKEKKEPWSIELGQRTLDSLTSKIKEAQNENSPDVDKWQKQLKKDIERQLKNCVAEYSKAKSLVEVANHIKDLETTGAAYLGEDMDEVYEKLKIKDEIKGIKNEAEAKQKLEKMLANKKELQAVSEKLMADVDQQLAPRKRKIAEEGRQLREEAMVGKAVEVKAAPKVLSTEELAGQHTSWFGKMLCKLGLSKSVEESDKEMEMVTKAEEARQEKAAEKKVNKMMKSYKKPKPSDQDDYLNYTQKPSRVQKIIDQQKNYPELRGKAFELPAQAADYLKEAGLPDALIDSATSRMKELRQDAKAHGMAEQAINEITQNFLTGITQKYKENPRLFGKKPPTSYEIRKMEELIDKVEKETREKAA